MSGLVFFSPSPTFFGGGGGVWGKRWGPQLQLTGEVSLLVAAAEEPSVLHELCLLVVGFPAPQPQPEEVVRLLALIQNLKKNTNYRLKRAVFMIVLICAIMK